MKPRLSALVAVLLAAVLTACGAQHPPKPKTVPLPPAAIKACPEAVNGNGSPGMCAPAGGSEHPLVGAKASSVGGAEGITYPDFSNNDPCYCAATLSVHGHPGEIDKTNQGTGFIDGTFQRMAADAKAHHLAVGGYDFDQEYTAAEAYTLVNALHKAGITRSSPRKFPPTLDVEFGTPSRRGLESQIAVLDREYGRAQIYTGSWYWLPHFGCWIPAGVTFWLSGYPAATLFCSLIDSRFVAHQYTDHGFNGAGFSDMTVWRGSAHSFSEYTQALPPGPTPAQIRASKVKSLRVHEALRAELHRLIERHDCRPGQHASPRSYHTVCGRWLREGQTATSVINRYHREGIK